MTITGCRWNSPIAYDGNLVILKFTQTIGGPGTGRAQLAETLKSKMTNYAHLSSGDLLQYELTHGSQRGEMLKEYMAGGDSCPNNIVDDMIMEAMVKADKSDVWRNYLN